MQNNKFTGIVVNHMQDQEKKMYSGEAYLAQSAGKYSNLTYYF